MGSSAVLLARRALVVLIRALAITYNVVVNCNRDSTDKEVVASFRKVILKVHPDHGGNDVDMGRLNDARAEWDKAKKQKDQGGRPKGPGMSGAGPRTPGGIALSWAPSDKDKRKEFRIQSQGALLTYMGWDDDGLEKWGRFADFVGRSLKRWGVKHWCATLEATKEGKPHVHLMLQFVGQVDRTTAAFVFEGVRPNARPTDLCGDGICRKRVQLSLDRGFFYVWADKLGTRRDEANQPCVAGNY
jgi:hypothetical protein